MSRGRGGRRKVLCAPLSRAVRGTVRWWDLFIVIPVLQLSSSLARPLINHSSTTHRLAKSLSLSLFPGLHIAAANLAVPPRGLSRSRRWPTKREGGKRANALYLCSRIPERGSKVDEDGRDVGGGEKMRD